MRTRLPLLTPLLAILAACGATAPQIGDPPLGGPTLSPTTQINARYTGTVPVTRVQAVLTGSSTVRGPDVPVANNAFTYPLPTDATVTSRARNITDTTFGAARCAGTVTNNSNPNARVVQLSYFDAFDGPTFAQVLSADESTTSGGTVGVTIYVWVYATEATRVTRQESCTLGGVPFSDSIDFQLLAGWNSVIGTSDVAADGRRTATYFTRPVGTVPVRRAPESVQSQGRR